MRITNIVLTYALISPSAFAFPVSHPEAVRGGYTENELPIQKAIMTDADVEKLKLEQIGNEREESATNPHTDQRINMTIEGNHVRGGPDFNATDAYDVIAIVNKAADVQTLTLHRFKTVDGKRIAIAPTTYKVSTGKERWSCETIKDKETGQPLRREARWTGTPNGFYQPYLLRADHHSSTYDDAAMLKAVFFNRMGIATHQGITSGPRLSHGCVRMTEEGSAEVFKAMLQTGGPTEGNSSLWRGVCPSQGRKSPEQLKSCLARAAARQAKWKKMVEDGVKEGHAQGLGPYSEQQQVPVIGKEGRVKRDEAGQPLMEAGYKALYVIQCIDKQGRDCSTTKIPERPDCGSNPAQVQAQRPAPPKVQAAQPDPVTKIFKGIFGI